MVKMMEGRNACRKTILSLEKSWYTRLAQCCNERIYAINQFSVNPWLNNYVTYLRTMVIFAILD